MKKNVLRIVSLFGCILVFSTVIFGQTMKKDPSPCEAIKGKTYIAWTSGKFDDNPDAAGAARIEFDRNGNGKSRQFFSYKPTDATGNHQLLTIKCEVTTDKNNTKLSFLHFFISSSGVDAGNVFITSYDNGSKIWAESGMPGRPMKGWMIQLPANPPTSDNIVK